MTTSAMTVTESLAMDFLVRGTHGVISALPSEFRAVDERRLPSEIPWRGLSPWINVILPVRKEESSYQITEISFAVESRPFVPRTPLGKKLLSLRNRAIASGMRLLSDDEVLEEVKRRRFASDYDLAPIDALHISAAVMADVDEFVTIEKDTKPMCRVREVTVISLYSSK